MPNEGFVFPAGIKKIRRHIPKEPQTSREMLKQQLAERPESGLMERAERLPRDEKARHAVDIMTRDSMESQRAYGNPHPSEEKTRQEMTELANVCEQKREAGEYKKK